MDAGAAAGGVQNEAEVGVIVVGDLRALVGGEGCGGVGGAGGDDGEVSRGEQSAQAVVEGEGNVFFELVVGQARARVRAAVGGIEQDESAGGTGNDGGGLRYWSLRSRCGWRGLGEGRKAAKGEQDGSDGLLPGGSQWIGLIVIAWSVVEGVGSS